MSPFRKFSASRTKMIFIPWALAICFAGIALAKVDPAVAAESPATIALKARVQQPLLLNEPTPAAHSSAAPMQPPPIFGVPGGCDGEVRAMHLRPDGSLILAGGFRFCGDMAANGIVAFDPETERFARFGTGINGVVQTLLVEGDQIHVGGEFSQAGEVAARNIARWDGRAWQPLGAGRFAAVQAIARHQGELFAAGDDGLGGGSIGRWNGTAWMETGAFDGAVLALREFRDELYAGGAFDRIDGVAGYALARWESGQWRHVANAPPFPVTVLDLQATAERLYLAGHYNNTRPFNALNGVALSYAPEAGFEQIRTALHPIIQVLVQATDDLQVVTAYQVYRLRNGANGAGIGVPLGGLIMAAVGSGERLYLGGSFRSFGDSRAVDDEVGESLIARGAVLVTRNAEGQPQPPTALISSRTNARIRAMLGTDEAIYIGGDFTRAHPQSANYVANWNGASWGAMGIDGVDRPVLALAAADDAVYVGGVFAQAGGQPASRIARYDGRWSALGSGAEDRDGARQTYVSAIATFAGEIYAGGDFQTMGGVRTNSIARWNGAAWRNVGGNQRGVGLSKPCFLDGCFVSQYAGVRDLQEYAGSLYVSGEFARVNSAPPAEPVNPSLTNTDGIARWDGQELLPITAVGGDTMGAFGGELLLSNREVASVVSGWNGVESRGLREQLTPPDARLLSLGSMASVNQRLYASSGLENAGVAFDQRRSGLLIWDGVTADTHPFALSFAGRTEPTVLATSGEHLLLGELPFARFPQPTVASVSADGTQGNFPSDQPTLSADGRVMAFVSSATNLPGEAGINVLLRYNNNRALYPISDLALRAYPEMAGHLFVEPSLSADGNAVAFTAEDFPNSSVFVSVGNRLSLVSRRADGAPASGRSRYPSLSPDGTQLAFVSDSTDLAGFEGSAPGVYVYTIGNAQLERIGMVTDLNHPPTMANQGTIGYASRQSTGSRQLRYSQVTGATRAEALICRNPVTDELANEDCQDLQLSANGRYGVFSSAASNLVADDNNGQVDVFWFVMDGGQVRALELVSRSTFGVAANGASIKPSLSDDGQLIAFLSIADNLVPLDRNGGVDAFVHFRPSGETQRVNFQLDPIATALSTTAIPKLSADGTTLALTSESGGNPERIQVLQTQVRRSSRADGFSPRALPTVGTTPLPLPFPNANPACPGGYFTAVVDDADGPGVTPGQWGMELLLQGPNRELAGGLNFGGQIDTVQPGFAGFNIANARGEAQLVRLSVTGHGRESVFVPLGARIEVARRSAAGRDILYDSGVRTLGLENPFEHELVVNPGYHEIVVYAEDESSDGNAIAGGLAAGQFFVSATTQFVDRVGGGFQGGAVVGGYHSKLANNSVSGFAGFCLVEAGSFSASVSELQGPIRPADLRLRVLNDQFVDVLHY